MPRSTDYVDTGRARLAVGSLGQRFVAMAAVAAVALGQSTAWAQAEEQGDAEPIVDRLARTVLFVAASNAGGTRNSGTAFTIRHDGHLYVVTAKHVVAGAAEVELLASRRDGSVGWFSMSKIEGRMPGSRWIMHPEADLAIHPFSVRWLPGISGNAIFGETLYEGDPHLLDQLVAIGFPYEIGSNPKNEHLSPVAKLATLVSGPGFRPTVSGRNILIEPPLFPGFSGAPVYSLDATPGTSQFRGRHTKLIGVYVGGVTDRDDKEILGRVVPSDDLIALLNSDAVKAYETESSSAEAN